MLFAVVTALLFTGCGGGSGTSGTGNVDLPDGKVLIFFDNATSQQYMYDTDSETFTNMNGTGENYDMTGKNGKLIVWFHHTDSGVDQKIVMLFDDFDINEGNLTHQYFHYLGHFHEENNVPVFAAHSADEFDPDNNASQKKLKALTALNAHLLEQEEVKEELEQALPAGETLCNFFVFEHDHEDENGTEEEAAPHIALTMSGKVYIFEENGGNLMQSQASFALDGVTECKENESSIVQYSEHGVLVFSAETQKLYLIDEHGIDFHQHSSWDISYFLPNGFTPTGFAGIGEGEDDDHDH